MADVESAVLYTLRVEAARFLHLDKERLSTLKQYVALLVKVSSVKSLNLQGFCLIGTILPFSLP